MEKRDIAKFQVIGRCCTMQTISLEEELKLIEGVPYDVDFYQDFSSIYLNEHPITEIAAAELMEFVQHFYEEPADYYPTAADYQWGQWVWESLEELKRQDRKLAKKWKARPKPQSIEEAEANFDRILDELLRG